MILIYSNAILIQMQNCVNLCKKKRRLRVDRQQLDKRVARDETLSLARRDLKRPTK